MAADEDEHVRDVYAQFGFALYYTQVLEYSLVNALIYTDLIPSITKKVRTREEREQEFDSFTQRHFETTLGTMIRRLSIATPVPLDLEDLLRRALSKRNWLAHRYFRDRSSEFMFKNGRDKMLAELKEARALFEEADNRLSEVIESMREKYGPTDEMLEQVSREILATYRDDG